MRFKDPAAKIVCVVLGLIVVTLLTGCDGSGDGSQAKSPSREKAVVSPRPNEEPLVPVKTPARFLKIVLLQDKSSSTGRTRTPQVDQTQMDSAIGLIQSGGEIAFGLINANSNQSLVRLRIDIPPSPPAEPSQEGNPWQADSDARAYSELRASYEEKSRLWKDTAAKNTETFNTQVSPLLALKADAGRSDIFGALQRAGLFVSEQEPNLSTPIYSYVLLISDGEDNVGSRYNPLPSDTQLLLVNGSATIGSLEKLRPKRFESIEAAMRFIASEQRQTASDK